MWCLKKSCSIVFFLLACGIYAAQSLEDYEDAVFVALTKDETQASVPVIFDHEGVDVRGTYDIKSGRFYAENAGVYWVALSAGANHHTSGYKVGYYLRQGGHDFCGLARGNSRHNGYSILSRDIMVNMSTLQHLDVRKTKKLYSSDGYETSFSVFRLTGLMKTNVFFSVARTAQTKLPSSYVVPFTEVFINEGKAFNPSSSYFTVPQDGYYFMSFSFGMFGVYQSVNQTYDMSLRRRLSLLGGIDHNCTHTRADFDTVSKAGLYHLSAGDIITVQSDKSDNLINSNPGILETSFSGFLYEPVHGQKLGFSVARRTNWQSSTAVDPVPFDDIMVNIEGNWNKSANVYHVSADGIYYVAVSIGALPGLPVDVKVMVDGVKQVSVAGYSTNRLGVEVFSRSAILTLRKGSTLSLRAEQGTGIYSSFDRQTSFCGFFLFPRKFIKY